MPLTSYVCQVPNGCRLFAPNNNAGVLYGSVQHPPFVLPTIRVGAGIDGQPTWFVWESGGNVIWAGPGNVQHASGLAANGQRTFQMLLVDQVVHFAIT
jgi:hypothetical protein